MVQTPSQFRKSQIRICSAWGLQDVILCLLVLFILPSHAQDQDVEAPTEILLYLSENSRQSLDYLDSIPGITKIERLLPQQTGIKLNDRQDNQRLSSTSQFVSRVRIVSIDPKLDPLHLAQEVERHPGILMAEPNYPIFIEDQKDILIPDDLQFIRQWHLRNTGEVERSIEGEDVDALAGWDIFTGDPEFLIAIVDTGIDFFHPDLEGNLSVNKNEIEGNGIDDDENGFIDDFYGYDFINDDQDPFDDNGHGTHVAGIAGAIGNNGIGVTGIAWNIKMLPVKAFNSRGQGDTSVAIKAVEYAVSHNVKIINASWGSDSRSRILEQVLKSARADGILTIAAAGNDRTDKESYPAAFESVVSVGSLDLEGKKSDFSNFGSTVAISAPGTSIFSTKVNNTYGALSGTSMATPIVSGVAALIWGKHPEFSLQDVENILFSSVDEIDVDEELGVGRINVRKALEIEEPIPTARLKLPTNQSGQFDIIGTASGETLMEYTLEYGPGNQPSDWTFIFRSNEKIEDGILFSQFSTKDLSDGEYVIRLRARNFQGKEAVAQKRIQVNNVDITSPRNNDFLAFGESVSIQGSVFGLGRTYSLEYGIGINPSEWAADGINIPDYIPGTLQNTELATWDTSRLVPGEIYALRLQATSEGGEIESAFSWLIYFDDQLASGWPLVIDLPETDLEKIDWRDFKVANLDGIGSQELILVQQGDGDLIPANVLVFDANGQLLWKRELDSDRVESGSVVIGNLDQSPELEIVVNGGGSRLFVLNHLGEDMNDSWPIRLSGSRFGKAIADVDGDGIQEIITFNNEAFFASNRPMRRLSVLNSSGQQLYAWDVDDCFHTEDVVEIIPALANLDDDSALELIIPIGCNGLGAFDITNEREPIWKSEISGQFLSSPIICDLDGDTFVEILAAAFDRDDINRGGLYAFSSDGSRYGSFPVLLESSFLDAPIVADFDNDFDLEIVLNSRASQQIHVIHHDGFHADGWPTEPLFNEKFRGQPSIGDINGDGQLEILAPTHGIFLLFANSGESDRLGGIRVYGFNGASIPNPMQINPNNWNPFPSPGAAVGDKNHLIQMVDFDNDGFTEILLSSVLDMSYVPNNPALIRPKNSFSVYVWDTDVSWRKDLFPWNTYQVDVQQTGWFINPPKPNIPPKINSIPDQITPSSSEWLAIDLSLFIEDQDHEFEELTITVSTEDGINAQLNDDYELVVITEDLGFQGKAEITIEVIDPREGEATKVINYIANRSLEFPQTVTDSIEVLEDSIVEINVLENDSDSDGSQPTLLAIAPSLYGKSRILDSGLLRFVPFANVNGEISIQYIVKGKLGGQSVGNLNISLTPVNDAPILGAEKIVLDEDSEVFIKPLENDFDPEMDAFSITSITPPLNGELDLVDGQTLRYKPSLNYFGEDTVRYLVHDIHGAESIGEARLIIRPVNDPPTAGDINVTMSQNSVKSIIYVGKDEDQDELEFSIFSAPKNGTVLSFPKVAEYKPNDGFIGVDSFQYVVSDSFNESEPATVTIQVEDRNNPPKARAANVFTLVGQPAEIFFEADDPDGDPYTIIIEKQPENGILEPTDDPFTFIYIVNDGFVGKDTITFYAEDDEDKGPSAKISIEVTDNNTPPRALDQFISTRLDIPVEFRLLASDREGTPLEIEVIDFPQHGQIEIDGVQATYTPESGFLGVDKLTYVAKDGVNTSRKASVFFRIKFSNDEPVVTEKKIVLLKGQSFTFELPVTDANGDELKSVIVKGPKNGLVFGKGTTYTYRPNASYFGDDSFTFRSWDGIIYGTIGEVEIEVRLTAQDVKLQIKDFSVSSENSFLMQTEATNGRTLILEFSSNLKDWVELDTREVVNQEAIFFGDIPDTEQGVQGFFRVRERDDTIAE